jgi:hypothetical protein
MPLHSPALALRRGGVHAIQDDDALTSTHFQLEDSTKWHVLRMEEALVAGTAPLSMVSCLRRPTVDPVAMEVRLEDELRAALGQHRSRSLPLGVDARVLWDDELGELLAPALAAYETEALTGVAPGNDEFQQARPHPSTVGLGLGLGLG